MHTSSAFLFTGLSAKGQTTTYTSSHRYLFSRQNRRFNVVIQAFRHIKWQARLKEIIFALDQRLEQVQMPESLTVTFREYYFY